MFELNRLYNVDCMEAMKEIPDGYFQLAIVDPPYGIGESGKKNKSRGRLAASQDYTPYFGGDRDAPPPEYFKELRRVSRNQIMIADIIPRKTRSAHGTAKLLPSATYRGVSFISSPV